MSYPNKKFIEEIVDLVKSLMNFCDYEITNHKDEINIFVKSEDLVSTLMFFKDNPSLNMDSLIDLTASGLTFKTTLALALGWLLFINVKHV